MALQRMRRKVIALRKLKEIGWETVNGWQGCFVAGEGPSSPIDIFYFERGFGGGRECLRNSRSLPGLPSTWFMPTPFVPRLFFTHRVFLVVVVMEGGMGELTTAVLLKPSTYHVAKLLQSRVS